MVAEYRQARRRQRSDRDEVAVLLAQVFGSRLPPDDVLDRLRGRRAA